MTTPSSAKRPFTKKKYSDFIAGLTLQSIWLCELSFTNEYGFEKPNEVPVNISVLGRWDIDEAKFVAQSRYEVMMKADSEDSSPPAIEIIAIFSASFDSKVQPNEAMLEEFTHSNLPVFTWPYMRQLFADLLARTGWDTFTLPTITRL